MVPKWLFPFVEITVIVPKTETCVCFFFFFLVNKKVSSINGFRLDLN